MPWDLARTRQPVASPAPCILPRIGRTVWRCSASSHRLAYPKRAVYPQSFSPLLHPVSAVLDLSSTTALCQDALPS